MAETSKPGRVRITCGVIAGGKHRDIGEEYSGPDAGILVECKRAEWLADALPEPKHTEPEATAVPAPEPEPKPKRGRRPGRPRKSRGD